jgi:DNA-binding transcriptional LysR family regulator
MAMEFRHLRYFLALAEEKHYGRAAQRLAITQPPLSLNIQQLEEAVGARLFDRDSKGVRLTAAGAAFREQAQALLARAEEARVLAREIEAGAVGRLRVGFVGSVLFGGLPEWVTAYREAHPRVDVALVELNSQDQIDALQRDEIDLGFIHTDRVPDTLNTAALRSDRFLCCLPEGHALARKRQIALRDLQGEAFVLFSRQASPDYHARIVDICSAAGFYPRVRHEVRHWLSVVAVVAQGLGVSLVPEPLKGAGLAGATFKPLAEPAPPSRVFCVWKPAVGSPARQAFISQLLAAPPQSRPNRNRRPA